MPTKSTILILLTAALLMACTAAQPQTPGTAGVPTASSRPPAGHQAIRSIAKAAGEDTAAHIAAMPLLRDPSPTAKNALQSLAALAQQDPGELRRLLDHPSLWPAITADWAPVVTTPEPQRREPSSLTRTKSPSRPGRQPFPAPDSLPST